MIKCFFKSIKNYLKYGVWVSHLYTDDRDLDFQTNVFYTPTSWRYSDSCEHKPGETCERGAWVITSHCIYCGKQQKSWIRNDRYMDYISDKAF